MKVIDMVGKLKTRPDKSYKKRKIEDVDQIVMHHSATKEGSPGGFR